MKTQNNKSYKKRKKTLVNAEKELKIAMHKVIEKYKALQNATTCNCGQNQTYYDYFASNKKIEEKDYSGKIGVLVIDDSEGFIDCFDNVDKRYDDPPSLDFNYPVKNLDDNTELKAWYKN